MPHERCVIGLLGPTASGKTKLAIELAERFDLSLISVDSAKVYRGMNIGTAKPKPALLQKYPHAMIDIVEPETSFSVNEFVHRADQAVRTSFATNKTPLLVGGTMMYFKAFREGISPLPPRDPEFRARLKERAIRAGIPALYTDLEAVDPQACRKIHPNNYPRIERALEVFALTGMPISEFFKEHAGVPATSRLNSDYFEFALVHQQREELHERVSSRLERMFEEGLVEEVQTLRQRPQLTGAANSMRTVGYRQLWEHFDEFPGTTITPRTKERMLIANRSLIRRQMTWLRNWATLPNFTQISSLPVLSFLLSTLTTLGVQPRR